MFKVEASKMKKNITKTNSLDNSIPTIINQSSQNNRKQIIFVKSILLCQLFVELYNKLMPKQIIISMQQNYPFGECQECTNELTRVRVRKIYQVSLQERNKLMQKVNVLRKLKNEYMIKIESVLQEQESIHFLFEYIPIKLQTWISNINDQFIQNFRDQVIKFSSFLANNYIRIDFQLKNIGMDQNYGAKYFLDINFDLDPTLNREKLKSSYIREITNLFKPYILNATKVNSSADSDKEAAKSREQASKANQPARKQQAAISPPTNKSNKSKEKALQKYYQEVNMSVDSQNQKILQEFMDVLENQEEEAPPKPPIITRRQSLHSNPTNHKASPSYQNVNSNYQNTNLSPSYQNNNNHQQYQQQQQNQSSNMLFSSQKQITVKNQPQTVRYSSKNIVPPKQIQKDFSYPDKQVQDTRRHTTLSMGKVKPELKEINEMWRESNDLQNRVKSAIQKSMSVIKRFKAIKQSIQE